MLQKFQLQKFQHKKNKQLLIKLYNQPYSFFKPYYNSIIPLNIFQTWPSKDLPPKMKECVELLKKQNPRFTHYLFDDNECREFIKNHFNYEVLNAGIGNTNTIMQINNFFENFSSKFEYELIVLNFFINESIYKDEFFKSLDLN